MTWDIRPSDNDAGRKRQFDRVCPYGFDHSEQSVRTVDILEKGGQGLNLTFEVRDGIRNHQTKGHPMTLEGCIVRLSDKIAYIHHDMDDAIRAGMLTEEDVPGDIREVLGTTTGARLNRFIHDIVSNSMGKDFCPNVGAGGGGDAGAEAFYV